MAWFADTLRSAIEAVSPRRNLPAPIGAMSPDLAFAAYMSSALLRKAIGIPAQDRVREWRDWQAEADQIEAIEAEEKRLGLRAKVRHAEMLRGVGGGAIILAAPGDPALPINARAIGKGGLAAINVVSRWQITGEDWVTEITDPAYGTPRFWAFSAAGRQVRIHPSRVVCFRGEPLPMLTSQGADDAFWGESRLSRIVTEVTRSDHAQAWFAELIKKAKLLRIGIGDLDQMDDEALSKRVSLIATGESTLNATLYQPAVGDRPGEEIKDFQVTWAGIPAMMDAFDQRVAAVADIPVTRLFGRSPAGMNATGKSDTDNYDRMVAAGQELELRPCLEALDEPLIRSAGVDPAGIWFRFSPLTTPSETEEAARFKTVMEAVEKVQATGAIPDEAFVKAVQNTLSEAGWMPGLDGALAELPEDIRFGLSPDPDDTDPSALTQGEEVIDPSAGEPGGDGSAARRRAANDKVMTDA